VKARGGGGRSSVPSVLDQWGDWLANATDRLMGLDERLSITASALPDADGVRLDVAAAFVCRKLIAARVEEIKVAPGDAVAASARPLVDDRGVQVADDLSGAAELLRAVLDRVETSIAAAEAAHHAVATDRTAARADLQVAARLSSELGHYVQRTAAAQMRLDAAGAASSELRAVAAEAVTLRSELERIAATRADSFARWRQLPGRLEMLRSREVEVRTLVETCRAKVMPLPALAVPSVAALGPVRAVDELAAMPWPAARVAMEPYLLRVDRIGAAFDEVSRRYGAVLDRRNELRGLLHAFRDKAAASGLGESTRLEPLLRGAERVLWSAPCDVVAADDLVQRYSAAVNEAIAGTATDASGPAHDGGRR